MTPEQERAKLRDYVILSKNNKIARFVSNSLDREEQLIQKLAYQETWIESLKDATENEVDTIDTLEAKVAERDKEIQQYKAALEEIAQGGDKDYVGNVLTLTSSECRMIARKALSQS